MTPEERNAAVQAEAAKRPKLTEDRKRRITLAMPPAQPCPKRAV